MQSNKINIAVGASVTIPCQGNGFWFESGTSTTTNLYIIVKPETGTEFRLKPGQHVQEPGTMSGTWTMRAEDPTAAITGNIIIGSGEFADNNTLNKVTLDATFANNVTVMNSTANRVPVALDPNATLNLASNIVVYTHKYAVAGGAAVANTAINMLPTATNVNGVVLNKFDAIDTAGSAASMAIIASAGAPTTVADGDVLWCGWVVNGMTKHEMDIGKQGQIKVPAGKGIWLITDNPVSFTLRDALFTVL
jgi:hypothetical protein